MKQNLCLFLALILICNSYSSFVERKTNKSNSKMDVQRKDVKSVNDLSPTPLIRQVKAQQTLEEIMRNNLHKSEVDLEPNRYHILSNAEHPSEMPTKGEKYYPGLPKIKTYNYNENANEAIKKRRHTYKLDRKPYYGGSNDAVEINYDDTNGLMKTPIEIKDLELFTDTAERLKTLEGEFKKLNDTNFPPNEEYNFDKDYPKYRGNTWKHADKQYSSLYYNPLEPSRNKTLEEMLKEINFIKTELMASRKVNAQAGEPIKYEKFPEMEKQYQSGRNSHMELQNKVIADSYYYDAQERIKNMTMSFEDKLKAQKDSNNDADLAKLHADELEESKKKIADMQGIKTQVEKDIAEKKQQEADATSYKEDNQAKDVTPSGDKKTVDVPEEPTAEEANEVAEGGDATDGAEGGDATDGADAGDANGRKKGTKKGSKLNAKSNKKLNVKSNVPKVVTKKDTRVEVPVKAVVKTDKIKNLKKH
jgi:hypothetical protein